MSRKLLVLFLSTATIAVIASACAQPAAPTPTPTVKAPAAQPTVAPTQAAKPSPAATSAPAAQPTATAAPKPAATATAAPAAVKPLSPAVRAKVGIQSIMANAGLMISLQWGYFKEEGLDVELVNFTSAAEQMALLGTGELAFGAGAVNPGIYNAVARGIDLKIAADESLVNPNLSGAGLLVRKDLFDGGQVKQPSQLKGKNVAINMKATTSEMYVERVLDKGGVKLSEVNLVEMPFPNMVAALTNKAIDAAWGVEPFVTSAVDRGIAIMLMPNWNVYNEHFSSVLFISPVFAKAQPEASKRFVTAHLRGQRDYYNAFVKRTAPIEPIIEILTKNTAVKDAALMKRLRVATVDPNGYIKAQFLADDQEYYFRKGYVKEKVDSAKLFDPQYVEYALQRLGKVN